MTIKDKMKTYNFWISLVSAVLLLLRIIGTKYDFEIDSSLVMDVTTGLCGIFVVLGIISAPQKNSAKIEQKSENECKKSKNSAIIAEIFGGGTVADEAQTVQIEPLENEKMGLVEPQISNVEVGMDGSACEVSEPQQVQNTSLSVEPILAPEDEVSVENVSDDFNSAEIPADNLNTQIDDVVESKDANPYSKLDYSLLTRDELIAIIKNASIDR